MASTGMALGYVILAHRKLGQAERLLRAIHHPEDRFVVHLDARIGATQIGGFKAKLADLPNVDVFSGFVCNWGGYSFTEGWLRASERLLSGGPAFSHCTVLSGADYPCRPRSEFVSYLDRHRGKQFVELWWQGDPADVPFEFKNRYAYYWPYEKLVASNRTRRRSMALQRMLRIDRPLPAGLLPVFGANWMTLTRSALSDVVRRARQPEISRFFKYTALPEEMLPHMLLRSTGHWQELAGRNLHYVTTAEDGRFPKLLTSDDLPGIRASGAFFCRKIEEGADRSLCDALDSEISLAPGAPAI